MPSAAFVIGLADAVAAIAADDVDREALFAVERRGVAGVGPDRADVDERDRDQHVAGRHAQILDEHRRAELEGDVLDRIGVVVDVDLVDRVGVEREVVRTAVGILQRDVVRHQRDEAAASGFVAAEHVEVRAVELRRLGDARRFAVARALPDRAAQQNEGQRLLPPVLSRTSWCTSFLFVLLQRVVAKRVFVRVREYYGRGKGMDWTVGSRQSAVVSRSRQSSRQSESSVRVDSLSRQSGALERASRMRLPTGTADSDCRLGLTTATHDCRLSIDRLHRLSTVRIRLSN